MNNNSFNKNISFREEFKKENGKKILANALINNKISISDLSNQQVSEMIIYFEKYINNLNIKLDNTKQKIKKLLNK